MEVRGVGMRMGGLLGLAGVTNNRGRERERATGVIALRGPEAKP